MKFNSILYFLFILHDKCSRKKTELPALGNSRESGVRCEKMLKGTGAPVSHRILDALLPPSGNTAPPCWVWNYTCVLF